MADELVSGVRSLYVANLDKNVKESLLYELFLQAGPIEKVSITQYWNRVAFNIGIVIYKHDVSVDYAEKLFEGTHLYNKELFISTSPPAGEPLSKRRRARERYGLEALRGHHSHRGQYQERNMNAHERRDRMAQPGHGNRYQRPREIFYHHPHRNVWRTRM